jgi:nitrogen regulatory protein PII
VPTVRIDLVAAPEQRRDEIIAAIQTIARTAQAGEDAILVFRTIGRAVRIPKSRD